MEARTATGWNFFFLIICIVFFVQCTTNAFVATTTKTSSRFLQSKWRKFSPPEQRYMSKSSDTNSNPMEYLIQQQVEEAKLALAEFKVEQELRKKNQQDGTTNNSNNNGQAAEQESPPPKKALFFATSTPSSKIDQVIIKNDKNETKAFRTDVKKMLDLADQEEWRARPLTEVLPEATSIPPELLAYASNRTTSRKMSERDVVMAIHQIRRSMNQADYKRIFDTRNYFIGEDS